MKSYYQLKFALNNGLFVWFCDLRGLLPKSSSLPMSVLSSEIFYFNGGGWLLKLLLFYPDILEGW
jgi:hypothetical protein